MNKKGWIKIVETFIAILLVASVALIVANKGDVGEEGVSSEIHDAQISIIRKIQLNNTLRGEILGTSGTVEWESFPSQAKSQIQGETPSYLECNAKICPPSDSCFLSGVQEKDIYAETVIISSSIETFNPRVLKLFCWIK